MTLIPFADWLPDIAPLGNEGVTIAKNVLPQARGYRCFPSLSVYPGPGGLSARVIGAFAAKDKDGNTFNYAATAGGANSGRVHVLSSGAWSNKSGTGTDGIDGYSLAEGETWEFAKWGETVLCCTIAEPVQSIAFGGGAFSNLIASARKPKARRIAVARDFVILGNIDDSVGGGATGVAPSRIWWSGINDAATFEEGGVTSQSDFQDLQSGGAVQKIVGGEFATIFCDSSIYRMTYVGAPIVWQFDEIERNRGVWVPGAVANAGRLTFFLDRDGFFVWDGQAATPIGVNKVDRTFLADFDFNYLHRVSAVADPVNRLYFCAYASINAIAGIPDRVIVYDWVNRRWSLGEMELEWVFRALSEGYTVDSLDTLVGSIDDLSTSLDSAIYAGRNVFLSAFDTSHRLCTFAGSALPATIETGEQQLAGLGGGRSLITAVRPVIDGSANVSISALGRNLSSGPATAGPISAVDARGECPMRSNARYHRFRAFMHGDFTAALGVEVTRHAPAGDR